MQYVLVKQRELRQLKEKINAYETEISEVTTYLTTLLESSMSSAGGLIPETRLGHTVKSLKDHLNKISLDEKQRNWVNIGIAQFADTLRNKDSQDLKHLAEQVISQLVKYLAVNQGALFLYHDDHADEYLEMIACYAYDRKKYQTKKISLGEGLAGQCVLEKDIIYIKQTPENYIAISSGLGEARPRELLIAPLCINDKVFGVVELASFTEFSAGKIELIKRIAENIATSIKTLRDNERVRSLLNESQQQAEELRSQEEEMRQNMEELQATQEEMERKSKEILRSTAEMSSVVTGINATMATIEFTVDGLILLANTNFLQVMGYALPAIKGKHHRMFVTQEEQLTDEYASFWQKLASGESFTGVFKRINAAGQVVWLNAIYNPIKDEKGTVIKIVKFASDITRQQNMISETKGLLRGIDATMAVIHFTPDGHIVDANENFLQSFECNAANIKGKHHRIFMPDDTFDADNYKKFWQQLANGVPITGEFKRITFSKRSVWLKAMYNPIIDASGKVVKVTKFAIDITMLKEGKAKMNPVAA